MNVKVRRMELGLTQEQLAERAGCDQRTVSAIERGEASPSLHLARAIARALDRTLDDLFGEAVGQ